MDPTLPFATLFCFLQWQIFFIGLLRIPAFYKLKFFVMGFKLVSMAHLGSISYYDHGKCQSLFSPSLVRFPSWLVCTELPSAATQCHHLRQLRLWLILIVMLYICAAASIVNYLLRHHFTSRATASLLLRAVMMMTYGRRTLLVYIRT